MLTQNEREWLNHVQRWGSDGFPIQKLSTGRWIWAEMFHVKGAPIVYKRKKDCLAAIEAYLQILLDKAADRL